MFHDATDDVLGVFNKDGLNVNTNLLTYLNTTPGKQAYHSVAIVIDNLSIPLLHRLPPLTCQTLADLREGKVQGTEEVKKTCFFNYQLIADLLYQLLVNTKC